MARRRRVRGLLGWSAAAILLLAGQGRPVAAATDVIRLGFVASIFSSVDRDDAMIAMQLWADELGRRHASGYRAEAVIYDDAEQAMREVVAGRTHTINLLAPDALAHTASLTPALIGVYPDGATAERFVLAVRVDSGLDSLAALRGAECVTAVGGVDPLARLWLDVALRDRGLPPARKHLRLRAVASAARGALPVFFGQVDACVVSARSLATLADLNPQVARELKVVASSPEILVGFTSFGPGCTPDMRRALTESALALPESAQGRQILELFGLSRVELYDDALAEGVRALITAGGNLQVNLAP